LDWDSTDSYLAVGLTVAASSDEVRVFYFDGVSLTENASVEIGGTVHAVSWIPQSSLLTIGQAASAESLRLYEHNSGAGTLTEKTTARVGDSEDVLTLAWKSTGIFLAAGRTSASGTHELRVFVYNSVGAKLSMAMSDELGFDLNTVAWSSDGNYIATGDAGKNVSIYRSDVTPLTVRDAKLFFGSDVLFTGEVVFEGACLINGGGNIFTFGDNGSIVVASGGSLLIEDAIIRGIGADDIACADNTATLTLRDVEWRQDSAFTFSFGLLVMKDDVSMSGDTIFAYQSSQPCSILANSILRLDTEFTFSYDPTSIASKDLLTFADGTSQLTLDGATLHATVTGLNLTNGKFIIDGHSTISSEVEGTIDEGITFGDGTAPGDIVCKVYSGSVLTVSSGSLVYNNTAASSWSMGNSYSILALSGDSRLVVLESLNLGSGGLQISKQASTSVASGKQLTATIFMVE